MVMAATAERPPIEPSAGGPATATATATATDGASITPPHSVNGKKEASDGNEMSDLELESKPAGAQEPAAAENKLEDIEPDHYYGGGKIPVFKPVSSLP